MMEYLAHSAKDGHPAQTYTEHISNVTETAVKNAEAIAKYCVLDGETVLRSIKNAAPFHDLGKLDCQNQEQLHNPTMHHLPIPHSDAGVAFLKSTKRETAFSQMLVGSHHGGLRDLNSECDRDDLFYRNASSEIRKTVDGELDRLVDIHNGLFKSEVSDEGIMQGDCSVLSRLLLSCLSDADHSDTARHEGMYPKDEKMPLLLPEQRLKQLDKYTDMLKNDSERSILRSEMYSFCKNASIDGNICSCDSPVGSGKTTAIMAHLLMQAQKRKARRIIVVLPFTNIIKQSVQVYREALTLQGENPTEVVSEIHHLADFENEDVRNLSVQWKAPVIVTTAVAFFETLSSNKPSTLRKLHELPGSMIFLDESHAAMSAKYLPIAWHWIKTFADEWSCYWLLASGSLTEFWKIPEINPETDNVNNLLPPEFRSKLRKYENRRVNFIYEPKPLSADGLIEKVMSVKGPRLVVVNTVQNAAYLANCIKNRYGQSNIMHISTALTAEDREKTVDEVKRRLSDKSDTEWTLVATSCVEAGVDFSFGNGFREISSLLSLLQTAGRINRNGNETDSSVISFTFCDDPMFSSNPNLKASVTVLKSYFDKGLIISPELSTKSLEDEIDLHSRDDFNLVERESASDFPFVCEKFHIIENDTVLAVTDAELKQRIISHTADWHDIQRKCVSVRRNYVSKYGLSEICEGVYDWNIGYDGFLGIMQGILGILNFKQDGFIS